jgi:diacylglycerol O-acyltransferase / wax synthase
VTSVDRLSAEDRLTLWSDALWPQDIGVVAILDGRCLLDPDGELRIETVREVLARRLHLVPRLRQRLHVPRRGLGWPLWVDDPAFDLAEHVQVRRLPAPGDEPQLLRVVEELRRQRLPAGRPLWAVWLLPGLPDGRIGLFVRLHHVVADGIAGMATLATLLDGTPDRAAPPEWRPAPLPSTGELLVDNLRRRAAELRRTGAALLRPTVTLRRVRSNWPAARELFLGRPGSRTSLDRLVGPDRNLALVRGDLEVVLGIAHAHDATVNDVLLTATAEGLRGLFRSRRESVEDVVVPIYVPVSLRDGQLGRAAGNRIGQMIVPLPLAAADPGQRLQLVAQESARRKALARPSLGAVFRSRVASGLMVKLIVRQRINLTSTDLTGPAIPLSFAGAPVLEVFPLLNLLGNVTLGIAGMSYAGRFGVLLVADADTVPDLEVLSTTLQRGLRALTTTAAG